MHGFQVKIKVPGCLEYYNNSLCTPIHSWISLSSPFIFCGEYIVREMQRKYMNILQTAHNPYNDMLLLQQTNTKWAPGRCDAHSLVAKHVLVFTRES